MLFMCVFTWEPDKTDEVVKRGMAEKIPEGMKIIGSWVELGSNRHFRLFEATDPKVILSGSFTWSNLGNRELVPVMETEEAMKLL